jgi:hypothetical protein
MPMSASPARESDVFRVYPTRVPQSWQNLAPAGRGAPQPAHRAAAAGAAVVVGVAIAAGGDGGGGAAAGGGAADFELAAISAPVVPIVAGEIPSADVSVRPHFGQAIQPGCSWARQSGQRPCPNGSVTPQNGHATADPSMNLPQYGQGCLNVGITTLPLRR